MGQENFKNVKAFAKGSDGETFTLELKANDKVWTDTSGTAQFKLLTNEKSWDNAWINTGSTHTITVGTEVTLENKNNYDSMSFSMTKDKTYKFTVKVVSKEVLKLTVTQE
ncbi:MAG: hypothetical protein ACTTKL_08205 [Treponema sp.]